MTEPAENTTDTQRSVARIWRDLLAVDEVGPDDNFFALGGRSLVAMKAIVQVRERFGVRVMLVDIFRTWFCATSPRCLTLVRTNERW